MTGTALGHAALALAGRGIHVFPLNPGRKVPLIPSAHPDGDPLHGKCKRDQCDRDGHGLHDATCDPGRIGAWWTRWPYASIGVSCGPSGLVVIDVDQPQLWRGLADRRGGAATRTVSVFTSRGRFHLWYRAPAGMTFGNSRGTLPKGIDVRGRGGLVVAPPSMHSSGRPYRWGPEAPLAELPDWLVRALTPPKPVFHKPAHIGGGDGGKVLAGLVQVVMDSVEGTRNDLLNWAAWTAGGHVAAGRFTRAEAEQALIAAGLAVADPKDRPGVPRTVASGLNAALRGVAA